MIPDCPTAKSPDLLSFVNVYVSENILHASQWDKQSTHPLGIQRRIYIKKINFDSMLIKRCVHAG